MGMDKELVIEMVGHREFMTHTITDEAFLQACEELFVTLEEALAMLLKVWSAPALGAGSAIQYIRPDILKRCNEIYSSDPRKTW